MVAARRRTPGDPFGLDRLEHPDFRGYRSLAIVEGESDALALWAAHGHEGRDVIGGPGASTWRSAWTEHANGDVATYAFGDGDGAGRALNAAARRDLPDAIAVELPDGEDVRSIVQRDGADALLDLIGEAERAAEIGSAILSATSLADLYAKLGLEEAIDRAA